MRVPVSFFSSLALALSLSAAPLAAQETAAPGPSFSLELNAAADTSGGSCRLTYVAVNSSEMVLSRTAYEVAIFDIDGAVTRLLALDFGELIAGKTKILQFDLADTECATISRIVVNDAAACTLGDGAGESDFCMQGLVASSRTSIQFGI